MKIRDHKKGKQAIVGLFIAFTAIAFAALLPPTRSADAATPTTKQTCAANIAFHWDTGTKKCVSNGNAFQIGINEIVYNGSIYKAWKPFAASVTQGYNVFIKEDPSGANGIPATDGSDTANYCVSPSSGYSDFRNYISVTSSTSATLHIVNDTTTCKAQTATVSLIQQGPKSPFYIDQSNVVHDWADTDSTNTLSQIFPAPEKRNPPITIYMTTGSAINSCSTIYVVDKSSGSEKDYFIPMATKADTASADQGTVSGLYKKYIQVINSSLDTSGCRMNSIALHNVYHAAGFVSKWTSSEDGGNGGAGYASTVVGIGFCAANSQTTYGAGQKFGTKLKDGGYGYGYHVDPCSGVDTNSSSNYIGSDYQTCVSDSNRSNDSPCSATAPQRTGVDSGPIVYSPTDYTFSKANNGNNVTAIDHIKGPISSFNDVGGPANHEAWLYTLKAPYINTETFTLAGTDGYQLEEPIPTMPLSSDWAKLGVIAPANLAPSQTGFSNPTSSSGGPTTTSCAVNGIGWIVCPVISFMATLNDAAIGVLDSFLNLDPTLTTDPNLTASWGTFRNIANVAFVIVFLLIIYSQITGAGVSNYGIKKLLPKIIIAAILVNISIYLCQIAVDISNILGHSIYSLFKSFPSGSASDIHPAGKWADVVGGILAAAAGVLLLLVVILAPTVLLAVGMAVLILIARKVAIVLLIVISPLAFVAYLLPNTESWFKKWWKMFSGLLMVYPVIGAVFGASYLAANIVNSAGAASHDKFAQLSALGIMAIPLFSVPLLLKGALSATGTVGAKLSGWQDRANKRAGRGVNEGRLGEAKTAWDRRRQGIQAERRAGIGNGLRARANRAFDRTQFGGLVGGARGAAHATSEYGKNYEEDVKAADTLLQASLGHDQILEAAQHGGVLQRDTAGTVVTDAAGNVVIDRALSEHEREAAVRYSVERGNFDERRAIASGAGTMTRSQRKSLVGGMRAKGDADIFGNAALGEIEATNNQGTTGHNEAGIEAILAGGVAAGINGRTLSVDTASRDYRTAGYIAGIATTPGGPVTPAARTAFGAAVTDLSTTNPQAWTKLSQNTRDSLSAI